MGDSLTVRRAVAEKNIHVRLLSDQNKRRLLFGYLNFRVQRDAKPKKTAVSSPISVQFVNILPIAMTFRSSSSVARSTERLRNGWIPTPADGFIIIFRSHTETVELTKKDRWTIDNQSFLTNN